METDPLRAIWKAMQTPRPPNFSFEEFKAVLRYRSGLVSHFYRAESSDFLGLVALNILETTQDAASPSMSIDDLKTCVKRAIYQIRRSHEAPKNQQSLPDVVIDENSTSPDALAEQQDLREHLKSFFLDYFTVEDVAVIEMMLDGQRLPNDELANKLGITAAALRRRKLRIRERIGSLKERIRERFPSL